MVKIFMVYLRKFLSLFIVLYFQNIECNLNYELQILVINRQFIFTDKTSLCIK